MKLNLFIIKDELKDFDFEISQYDPDGVFNLSNVHLCTKVKQDMQTGIAYVVKSSLLPDINKIYCFLSIICIGKPPLEWMSSRTNILYTQKEIDPQTIYDKVAAVFEKYQKINDELSALFDKSDELSCLDKFLPRYISNPFNIINSAYEPIYQYFPKLDQNRLAAARKLPNYNFYYTGEQRVISNAEIYMHSTDRRFRGISKAGNPSLYRLLGTGVNMLFQNLYVDDSKVGYIEIIELVNPIKTSDYLILLTIMQHLKYWFKIHRRQISIINDIGAMTYALLRDKNISYGRLAYTMDKAGWAIRDEYILLLVNMVGSAVSIPKVDSYIKSISSGIPQLGHTVFDNYLVILCNLTRSGLRWEEAYDYIRKKENSNPSIKTSISIAFSPIHNAYFAFTQTRAISKLGIMRHSERNVYTLEEMLIDYLLYKCRRNQIPEMIFPDSLKRLINYDKSKGTDLVGLLSIYLDTERSVTKTSELAYLHRNTTMYRLRKIEEIMGTDLENPDERLVLQIALREKERSIPDVSNINLSEIDGITQKPSSQKPVKIEVDNIIDWF